MLVKSEHYVVIVIEVITILSHFLASPDTKMYSTVQLSSIDDKMPSTTQLMAHFQLGSFLIGLVSNWAQF